MKPGAARLAIVGAGRAGGALGVLLSRAGWKIVAVASRETREARRLARLTGARIATSNPARAAAQANAVLIAVPDREILSVASALAAVAGTGARRVALHVSGAVGAEVLEPLRRNGWATGSMHPLIAFPPRPLPPPDPAGATFAIDGDPRARTLARRLASSLGGRTLELRPVQRATYHLAACFASNYVVTLASESVSLLARAGMSRRAALDAVLPLMRATLVNLETAGLPDALTGPVARGDAVTVARHVAILRSAPAGLIALHRELVRRTAGIAHAAGWLDKRAVRRIGRALVDR